jgi:hypothetical protein
MMYTPHQQQYFAEQLMLSRPRREVEALASSMSSIKVDLKGAIKIEETRNH